MYNCPDCGEIFSTPEERRRRENYGEYFGYPNSMRTSYTHHCPYCGEEITEDDEIIDISLFDGLDEPEEEDDCQRKESIYA